MQAAACKAHVQRQCQLMATNHSQGHPLRPHNALHHGGGGRSKDLQHTSQGSMRNPLEPSLHSCRSACRGVNIDMQLGSKT